MSLSDLANRFNNNEKELKKDPKRSIAGYKKMFAIALTGLALGSLTGCGKTTAPKESTSMEQEAFIKEDLLAQAEDAIVSLVYDTSDVEKEEAFISYTTSTMKDSFGITISSILGTDVYEKYSCSTTSPDAPKVVRKLIEKMNKINEEETPSQKELGKLEQALLEFEEADLVFSGDKIILGKDLETQEPFQVKTGPVFKDDFDR